MPCNLYHNTDGSCAAVICTGGPLYDFGGHLFEMHSYFGPIPLRRDNHDPKAKIPADFWLAWERFEKLSKQEQDKFRFED